VNKTCSTHRRDVKCTYFAAKPEGNRPLIICMQRIEHNIKRELGEIGYKSVDWLYLDQDMN
jgi:hypothetical protein